MTLFDALEPEPALADSRRATYVAFDLETTGVDTFTDVPVSFGFVERRGDAPLHRSGSLVNPGVAIPHEASRIHGITDDMVREASSLEEATAHIVERLGATWRDGGVLVGMNVSYDLTMTDTLCRRTFGQGLEERGGIGPVMDTLVLDRHFDKWRKGARRLDDLCRHYGVTIDKAHSAVDDAQASLEVFEAQTRRFPEILSIERDAICEELRSWYQEWLSSFSAYLVQRGGTPIERGRYDWPIHSPE